MKQYLKRTAAFLAACSTMMSTMLYVPSSAFAISSVEFNFYSLTEQNSEIPEIILEPDFFADFPDSHELFAGYVNRTFYGNDSTTFSVGRRTAGSQLTGDAAIVYRALAGEIKKIASGQRTSTAISIGTGGDVVPDEKFTGTLSDLFNGGIQAALNALLLDFPYEMYWFDKTTSLQANGSEHILTGKMTYCKLMMPVSKDYALNYDERDNAQNFTTNAVLTSAASTAVANASSIVEKYKGSLDHQKLQGYMQTICALTEYNHNAASGAITFYGDPWQMIYVFDNDPTTNVVCEGYSKAFQYLCDRTEFYGDISCYTITGVLNGGHMWNIVTMENGNNYLVDVTNSDAKSIGKNGELFLAGASGSVSTGYTLTAANNMQLTYQYDKLNPWSEEVLTLAETDYVWDTVAGDVVLNEDTTIEAGCVLTILDGATLTIPDGVNFVNNGTLNFLGSGQQIFGSVKGTGKIYVNGSVHVHNRDGNAEYTQISGDDINHLKTGSCFGCPVGYTEVNGINDPHAFDVNGFCTKCDSYEPAVRNTANILEIGNAGQLYWFADKVNHNNDDFGDADVVLTDNIIVNQDVLNDTGELNSGILRKWISIGSQTNQFKGSFNGNNHRISGLYFDHSTINVGFFGYAGEEAVISNIGIVDSYFNGGANTEAGGLISRNYGNIKNCYVMASILGDSIASGGLCGRNYGNIANCYFLGNVSGMDDVGVLCGRNYGTFSNCYFNSDSHAINAIGDNYADFVGDDVRGITTDAFMNGEAAYLLQNNQDDSVWGQVIGTDTYPMLGGEKVYLVNEYDCPGDDEPSHCFSNTNENVYISDTHLFHNGACTICGFLCEHHIVEGRCTVCGITTVVGYRYLVKPRDSQFYFSDDDTELKTEDLIESIVRYEVYADGSVANVGEPVTDFECVDLNGITPKNLYLKSEYAYPVTLYITDEYGKQEVESSIVVYIGVKGDANMDGSADAKDAAEILVYAAAVGAGKETTLYSRTNEILEKFVKMLADVNGGGGADSSLDATDAAAILVYAAGVGSGKNPSWQEIIGIT